MFKPTNVPNPEPTNPKPLKPTNVPNPKLTIKPKTHPLFQNVIHKKRKLNNGSSIFINNNNNNQNNNKNIDNNGFPFIG